MNRHRLTNSLYTMTTTTMVLDIIMVRDGERKLAQLGMSEWVLNITSEKEPSLKAFCRVKSFKYNICTEHKNTHK